MLHRDTDCLQGTLKVGCSFEFWTGVGLEGCNVDFIHMLSILFGTELVSVFDRKQV